MGNTVLTFLKVMKHPNIVRHVHEMKNVCQWGVHQTNDSSEMSWQHTENRHGESLFEINMKFHNNQEEYHFFIHQYHFTLMRNRVSHKYKEYAPTWPVRKRVAEMVEIEYNIVDDIEALLFQYSILGDFGMVGINEIKMIIKLRDIYFGENT